MTSYEDAINTLMNSLSTLNQAYKAANAVDAKDKIFSAMEVIQDEVNSISAAGLTASNEQYQAIAADFKTSAQELTQLQKNINSYVNFISTANSVVSALANVIPLVAMV